MSFEARLLGAKPFKQVVAAMNGLLTEVVFECSAKGMSVNSMDSNHVSLVHVLLKPGGFEQYSAPTRNVSIGIGLATLLSVLRSCGDDDALTLTHGEGDTLSLLFEPEEQARVSLFKLNLLNIDYDPTGIPPRDYDCEFSMPSVEFQRITRELHAFGETLVIRASKTGVEFSVKGSSGSGSIVLKDLDIKLTKQVQTTMALRYVCMFARAAPLSESVVVKFGADTPMQVEYVLNAILGFVQFHLAPKLDDEVE
jgi:proliferating cell nuclear antigen